MFPVAPRQGGGDSRTTHLKSSRYPIMALAIVAVASRFAHLRLGELRTMVLRSSGFLNTQNPVSVKTILAWSNPLKICNAVVCFVAVFMISLIGTNGFSVEVAQNKTAEPVEFPAFDVVQPHHVVAALNYVRLNQSSGVPSFIEINSPANATVRGNFIARIIGYGTPLLSHVLSISPHVTKAVA